MRPLHSLRTTFSLAHLADLSDERDLILLLSERSLYLIENLAALDITDASRYATAYSKSGYEPVRENDAEYPLYVDVRDAAHLELLEAYMDGPFYGVKGSAILKGTYVVLDNGDKWLYFVPVPDGEIYQVEAISVVNSAHGNVYVSLGVIRASDLLVLEVFTDTLASLYSSWRGRVTLAPGDIIFAYFAGCIAGDILSGVAFNAVLSQ